MQLFGLSTLALLAGASGLRPDADDYPPRLGNSLAGDTHNRKSEGALEPWEIPTKFDEGVDFDDGLTILFKSRAWDHMKTNSEDGRKLAQRWTGYSEGELKPHFMRLYGVHYMDAVASKLHKFMFIDNVKAGSTSIRSLLSGSLQRSWTNTDFEGCTRQGYWGRYSTGDFAEQAELFKFASVRDPVAKFESGVREAKAQQPGKFQGMTADEMLDWQIEAWRDAQEAGDNAMGPWINEHLQPSTFRLFAFGSGENPSLVQLDFIAKIEHMEDDWPAIVESMENIDEATKSTLLQIKHANSRPHDAASKLSPAGIKKMCESEVYKFEWTCFDYTLPAECQ